MSVATLLSNFDHTIATVFDYAATAPVERSAAACQSNKMHHAPSSSLRRQCYVEYCTIITLRWPVLMCLLSCFNLACFQFRAFKSPAILARPNFPILRAAKRTKCGKRALWKHSLRIGLLKCWQVCWHRYFQELPVTSPSSMYEWNDKLGRSCTTTALQNSADCWRSRKRKSSDTAWQTT